MALSIVRCLEQLGRIDANTLARMFASAFARDPGRGYGGMARRILQKIEAGVPWPIATREAFGGKGSMGNGGAMRVAPLGAYFADDPQLLVEQARLSAVVTHAHEEGQAGAIAVAAAAAWAWNHRVAEAGTEPRELIRHAWEQTPEGATRSKLAEALATPLEIPPRAAARVLGNGSKVIAPDTVPFAVWCAARHWKDYPDALWSTMSVLGDVDTNCAIVGGIVALSAGRKSIPASWLKHREPLDLG